MTEQNQKLNLDNNQKSDLNKENQTLEEQYLVTDILIKQIIENNKPSNFLEEITSIFKFNFQLFKKLSAFSKKYADFLLEEFLLPLFLGLMLTTLGFSLVFWFFSLFFTSSYFDTLNILYHYSVNFFIVLFIATGFASVLNVVTVVQNQKSMHKLLSFLKYEQSVFENKMQNKEIDENDFYVKKTKTWLNHHVIKIDNYFKQKYTIIEKTMLFSFYIFVFTFIMLTKPFMITFQFFTENDLVDSFSQNKDDILSSFYLAFDLKWSLLFISSIVFYYCYKSLKLNNVIKNYFNKEKYSISDYLINKGDEKVKNEYKEAILTYFNIKNMSELTEKMKNFS